MLLLLLSSALANPPHRAVFESIAETVPEDRPYGVTDTLWLDDRRVDVRYQEILRVGDQPGDSPLPFGTLRDQAGQPFNPGFPPFTNVCNQTDYMAIQEAHGKIWMWTHFECPRGAMYLTELSLDHKTGSLTAIHTKPVDDALTAQGGLSSPCAGDLTPWGSLLSSEEYEPNARYWDFDTGVMGDGDYHTRSINHLATAFAHPTEAHPYRLGWIPEFWVKDAAGTVEATKHYTLGRFSHEIARVMPDRRTVVLSDDGYGIGLFLFVADTADDLSAGTLYAAQWTLQSSLGSGAGRLDWVSLGHATDDEVRSWVEGPSPVRFTDLFVQTDVPASGVCAPGFVAVEPYGEVECLKLAPPSARVPDPAKAASRLETRRYAGMLGATLEWKKGEGLASTGSGRTVYFAVSDISGEMTAGSPPAPAADNVRLATNRCGAVYAAGTTAAATDTAGTRIDSPYVPWELHAAVAGLPHLDGTCSPASISNPDNVTFLDGYDLLAIAEDTRRAPDSLWMWDRHEDTLARVLLAPPEAELAGLGWIPDLGGAAWLTVSLQSPGPDTGEAAPVDPSLNGKPYGSVDNDLRSVVGVLGPLPQP
jgi:secreted PhoX family phosphatase